MIYFLFLQVSLLCIKISKSYNPTIFRTPANRFGLRIVTHLTDRYINDKKGSHSRRWHSCSGKVQIFFPDIRTEKPWCSSHANRKLSRAAHTRNFLYFFPLEGVFKTNFLFFWLLSPYLELYFLIMFLALPWNVQIWSKFRLNYCLL